VHAPHLLERDHQLVDVHVRNILRELGAPNRGRARAEAARLGIGA